MLFELLINFLRTNKIPCIVTQVSKVVHKEGYRGFKKPGRDPGQGKCHQET